MKFLWGLLVGLAVGIGVGLLLAPQSGEATRQQLTEQGVMLRDRSGNLTGDLMARAGGLGEQIRARATDALSQGRELYTRTKDDLTERYSQAKSGNL